MGFDIFAFLGFQTLNNALHHNALHRAEFPIALDFFP